MKSSEAATAVVCIPVCFFLGLVTGTLFPGALKEWYTLLIDTAVAAGTVGAVIVAVGQNSLSRKDARSLAFRESAVSNLDKAIGDFLSAKDSSGRPSNGRRHWLNFARAIQTSRDLADLVESSEQQKIWKIQEHVLRERVYDILQPFGESYPVSYYRDPEAFAGEIMPPLSIAEQSLRVVYLWVTWPKDLPDPIDRTMKFTELELDQMRSFGPRGVAQYVDYLRTAGSGRPPIQVQTL